MMQEVKIAGSRVGVLIGKGGATKKELETRTCTTITIDSKEGLINVEVLRRTLSSSSGQSRSSMPLTAVSLLSGHSK